MLLNIDKNSRWSYLLVCVNYKINFLLSKCNWLRSATTTNLA